MLAFSFYLASLEELLDDASVHQSGRLRKMVTSSSHQVGPSSLEDEHNHQDITQNFQTIFHLESTLRFWEIAFVEARNHYLAEVAS